MALASKSKRKVIVSLIATSFATATISIIGFCVFLNGGDITPWVIAFFILYAFELPYVTFLAIRETQTPEYRRQRSLRKRREQARLNGL